VCAKQREHKDAAGAPTLPTTFRYTGQRSETGLGPSGGEGLMFYGARWYDPYLSRWIQPDTIIPDPQNSTDYDRYSYVRNNPTNYTDSTGHCVEGSDDYDSCMEWVSRIEKEWDFVNVTTCTSDDTVQGCIGWTAKEMELLYDTLSEYTLFEYIDDTSVNFIRTKSDDYAGQYDPSTGDIRISDLAWNTPPLMGIQDLFDPLFKRSDNFQGVIAHELTHTAQYSHPELRDRYKDVVDDLSPMENFLFSVTVGVFYDWSYYDKYKNEPNYEQLIQDEYMALVVSGFAYGWP
jgi:RHS repeat-associated protein